MLKDFTTFSDFLKKVKKAYLKGLPEAFSTLWKGKGCTEENTGKLQFSHISPRKIAYVNMVLHITCVISETDKASDNVALFSRYFKTPFVYNLD